MSKPTVDEKSLAHDMLTVADFLENISQDQRFQNVFIWGMVPARTEWDAATLRKEAAKLLGVEVAR